MHKIENTKKTKLVHLLILIAFVLLLSSCAREIKYTEQIGSFGKADIEEVEYVYNYDYGTGFYSSLEFEIESGKVLWEIYGPDKTLLYEGYVIRRDGKTIRAITVPKRPEIEGYNLEKEQAEPETFDYLEFISHMTEKINGEYHLILKPVSAECKFVIKWYNRLPMK